VKRLLKSLLWLVPLSVLVSFGASLVVVWVMSRAGWVTFDSGTAVIVGMLTAAASGTCLTAVLLLQREE